MLRMTVRGDLLLASFLVPILITLLLPEPVRAATVLPECARTGEWRRFDGEHFALVNKGKIDEAIAIFDEVGKNAEDPAIVLQAREAADKLRAFRTQQGSASSRR